MATGESELNRCSGYGATVGARREVPGRAEEYVWPSQEVPLFGCNHLVCRACGARVKDHAELARGVDHTSDLPARIYDADDLQALVAARALVRDLNTRLYVCRCQMFVAPGEARMDDPYYDDYALPAPRDWSCAGHPRLALPVVVDGETLGPDTDWGALVRGALAGTRATPRPAYLRFDRGHWVERLYWELVHTPFAPAVVEGMRAARGDGDPEVAAAAERLWTRVDPKPGRPPANG